MPSSSASRTRTINAASSAVFAVPLRVDGPTISMLSGSGAGVVSVVVPVVGVVPCPGAGIVSVDELLYPVALAYNVCAPVALGSVMILEAEVEPLGIVTVWANAPPWKVTTSPALGIVRPEVVTRICCWVPDRVPTLLNVRLPGAIRATVIVRLAVV